LKNFSRKVSRKEAIRRLRRIYDDIPSTKGCEENITSCKAWCCQIQNPQLLYIEFIILWNYLINECSYKFIEEVIEKSVRNYISNKPIKGCIFWDNETCFCKIHKHRPLACRLYGITPHEEFEKRRAILTEQYKSNSDAIFKPQCPLVSIENGAKITEQDTNKWWNQSCNIEESIGVSRNEINDEIGGSYRTYHDHILLYIMPNSIMDELQKLRLMENDIEKDLAVKILMDRLHNNIITLRQKKNGSR